MTTPPAEAQGHSPLPWFSLEIGGESGTDSVRVAYLQGPHWLTRDKTTGLLPADAALIVERVNGWGALVAENARMREALKPFAAFAEAALKGTREHLSDDTPFYGFDFVQITYGDLRRSSAALSTHTGGTRDGE